MGENKTEANFSLYTVYWAENSDVFSRNDKPLGTPVCFVTD